MNSLCRWALTALLCMGLAIAAYEGRQPQALPTLPGQRLSPSSLAVGDWLFRLGTSTDSRIVEQVSGSRFSHVGMVVATTPMVLIVHATTDDDPAHPNQVLLTPLDEFLKPDMARHFAVARPTFLNPEQKERIAQYLKSTLGRTFVLEPRDKPHLYCTTLLAEAIATQLPSFAPRWTSLDVPVFRGDYLFPQAFADYPGLEWIYRQ